MTSQKFEPGDRVTWPSGSGRAEGTVEEKVTSAKQVEGHCVDASEESPRYLVENDNTGNVTGHKPSTLSAQAAQPSDSHSDEFSKGDRVTWNTSQGETSGTVKEKITSPTSIKGHDVQASEEKPQYRVESEKTGKQAAHKPESLECDE